MAIQFLRGTTAENDNYTGPVGSFTIDTDKMQLRVHDGTTQGGHVFLNLSDLATPTSDGFMSSEDKQKLDGIDSGAEANDVNSVNGKTGSVTLDTGDISEGSNLYHTAQRAINAIQGDASWNASNWDTAYGWGDHSQAGYALLSNLSTVATTGDYADLTNKPDLSTSWGDIGGSITNQTDLQQALNAKAPVDSPTFTGTVTIDQGEL